MVQQLDPSDWELSITYPISGYALSVSELQPLSALRDGQRRTATEAEARALASATRLRILRACLDVPLTNKEIAQRIGKNPATVLHHVRTLVSTGFLTPAGERRGARGAREVPYLATGKSWLMQVESPSPQDHLLAAFLEEVAVVGEANLDSNRLGLRLSDEEYEEFRTRLAELMEEYARRPFTPGGRRWSLYVGIHPEEAGADGIP